MSPIIRVLQAVLVGLQTLFAGLAASSLLLDLHPTVGVVAAAGILATAACQHGLNTFMNNTVVESVEKGAVIAGPANELPTGAFVRPAGSLGLQSD